MRRSLVALVTGCTALVLILLAAGAAAQTQTPGFGHVIDEVDDREHLLETNNNHDLQFRDSDEDGTLDRDEPVYLAESSTLEEGDLRITATFAGDAFTKVQSGDGDAGRDLTTLDGTFRYFDVNADGAFTPDDTLYYDIASTSQGEASRGDVILAGQDAGTLVTTDHAYNRFGLDELDQEPPVGYYDEDEDGSLAQSEALMIDTDDDGYVTIADARLGDTDGGQAGTVVGFGDADTTYRLADFDDALEFQFIGDGGYGSNDPSLLTAGDQVNRNAIRLANPLDDHAPGSQVGTGDTDWGIGTTSLDGDIAYVDDDGDGELTAGDTVYYDVDNDGDVDRGDIILAGDDAGETATGTNANLGADLDAWSGTLRYLDTNADNQYSTGDIVFADTDNDDIVDEGAVQLSQNPDADAAPPSLTITDPASDDAIHVEQNVTIQGTATAGDAELDTVELTVGDEDLDVTGLESWNATWTPTEAGEHTLTATVTDADGLTNSTTLTVNVDEEPPGDPPTLTITTPADEDTFTEAETVTIEGTATAGDAALHEVTVEIGGDEQPVDGLANWSATWEPEGPGSYLLEATVTDEDDLTATQHVNLSITETQEPPTVTITNPGDGTEVTVGETVTIEGTASAGSADITRIRVTVGGDELDVDGTGEWSAEWTPESEGDHVIQATARDQDAQTATDSITVTTVAETPAPGLIAVMIAALAAAGIARKGR